jgi:EAL domain-containing protein (putative c-di-GMP-specific phosphodiesterase class I)
MNVNISGRDLYDANLAHHVAQILERTGLPPSGLELEVTESVLLDDRAIASLDKIRALGVRIAVDDFGVSYSVLSSIKRLPITTLKIDRSFVDGVVTSILDQAICKAIVTLGKSLGLRIVAEGVETEGQMRFVSDLEVDEIQGYYTGRPITATAFLETIGKVIPLERAVRRA